MIKQYNNKKEFIMRLFIMYFCLSGIFCFLKFKWNMTHDNDCRKQLRESLYELCKTELNMNNDTVDTVCLYMCLLLGWFILPIAYIRKILCL